MSYLRSQDLFGYAVNFSFNKKGNEHRTKLGGFCSILIKLALFTYAGILIQKMITRSDNKNETFTLTANKNLEIKFGATDIKYTLAMTDINAG